MDNVGAGSDSMEHARYTQLKTSWRSSWKIRLLPHCQCSPKLPGQCGIKHIERPSYSCRSGNAPNCQHRPAQKAPPRKTLLRNLCGLSTTTMQNLVLLRCDIWCIDTTHNYLFGLSLAYRSK